MHAESLRQVDTVLFDLGGVIFKNGRQSDLVRRFPPEHADAALRIFMGDYAADTDHPWHRLERGELSFEECRRLNGEELRAQGIKMVSVVPQAENGSAAPAKASLPDFKPDNEMVDLVRQLRAGGIRTGLLTNNVREFKPLWRPLLAFEELFDDIVDSHEVGMRKPNPAIYQLALTRLSARPERSVFLDDVQSNVDAATNLGLFGVLVEEDSAAARSTVAALAGLGS